MTVKTPASLSVIPALSVGPFTATRKGLIIHDDEPIAIEIWAAYVTSLIEIEEAGTIQLLIGEALNWGEATYGQACYQYLNEHNYVEGTIANWKWAANRIRDLPDSLRNDDAFSFSHFVAIAPCEPEKQRRWLEKAKEENWSARRLRKEIAKASIPVGDTTITVRVVMDFQLSDSLQNRLKEAAHRFKWAAEEWGIECKSLDVSEVEP